jgi:hypothetical protein
MSVAWPRLLAVPLGLLALLLRLAADVNLKPLTEGPRAGLGYLAWLSAIAAAAVGPLIIWSLLTRRVPETPVSLRLDGAARRFLVPRSPGNAARWVIATMWVVSGDYLVSRQAPPIALTVGAAVAVGVFIALLDRPSLALDPDGLTVQHLLRGTRTAWADADRLDVARRGHVHHLALHRRAAEGSPPPPPQRLPVDSLQVDDAYLAAVIRHYLDNPDHRAAIGTADELARLDATLRPAETGATA